jgi:hypothetical protein
MRAREFIIEQADLPPEQKEPLQSTFVLPGLSAADPYKNYRFGVAIARARSDASDQTNDNEFKPEWSAETAFGEHAVIVGFNNNVDPIIDAALKMTKTPGGKKIVSTAKSEEPKFVDNKSPIKGFKGYPR